eukprot:TRINITY_DN595_c0_g1_i2.p1 TRINITY_DN595_c0_g1~~TRINITY_DN595_c0_g1_i2.p1  ORF type:complete len:218 (+),score=42.22 TRINITY_DN595_c0_g1_i2:57-710(+)
MILFVLTGFGKFGGIEDNPTTHLITNLPEYLQSHPLSEQVQVVSYNVYEVAADPATESLNLDWTNLSNNPHFNNAEHVVFLHFGVAGNSHNIRLECQGFNNATFRIPDERGYQPDAVPIIPENGTIEHSLRSTLRVKSLCTSLLSQGHDVEKSYDASTFLCNYIFYLSLQKCQDSSRNAHSLFLHVPHFTKIDMEKQLAFSRDLLENISLTLTSEDQ